MRSATREPPENVAKWIGALPEDRGSPTWLGGFEVSWVLPPDSNLPAWTDVQELAQAGFVDACLTTTPVWSVCFVDASGNEVKTIYRLGVSFVSDEGGLVHLVMGSTTVAKLRPESPEDGRNLVSVEMPPDAKVVMETFRRVPGVGEGDTFICAETGALEYVGIAAAVFSLLLQRAGLSLSEWGLVQDLADEGAVISPLQLSYRGIPARRAATALRRAAAYRLIRRVEGGYQVAPALSWYSMVVHLLPEFGLSLEDVLGERPGRQRIPAQLRFRILQRDGFRCVYCGRSEQDGAVLHIDHVTPVASGGLTVEGNLATACDQCNLGKSDTDVV
jgi:HNH endonuclease